MSLPKSFHFSWTLYYDSPGYHKNYKEISDPNTWRKNIAKVHPPFNDWKTFWEIYNNITTPIYIFHNSSYIYVSEKYNWEDLFEESAIRQKLNKKKYISLFHSLSDDLDIDAIWKRLVVLSFISDNIVYISIKRKMKTFLINFKLERESRSTLQAINKIIDRGSSADESKKAQEE